MKSGPEARKNVLILAFHFPPCGGSSGVLRASKFARYLPERGWNPIVLTVDERAYERVDRERSMNLSADLVVLRAFGLDTKKHLSFGGRYPKWLALPDRWVTWCLGAIPRGVLATYQKDIDVVYSTFPIATTVLIGLCIRMITGKPWIVDFRDSMTEEHYPVDPLTRRIWRWIEKGAIRHGTRFVFTAPSARDMYLKRYPGLDADRCLVIPNGFDEEDFVGLEPAGSFRGSPGRQMRLLHSGLIYKEERDPKAFFRALSRLKRDGALDPGTIRVELRGSGAEEYFGAICRDLGIDDLVRFLPPVTYRDALREMADADGLLLLQAANCNHQIPAKVYEYLRLGKPILALTDAEGDTAGLLRETGGATIVDLADEKAITRGFTVFLEQARNGSHPFPDQRKVVQYSRMAQTWRLADCLDSVSCGKGT